jgi:hypothetical protein
MQGCSNLEKTGSAVAMIGARLSASLLSVRSGGKGPRRSKAGYGSLRLRALVFAVVLSLALWAAIIAVVLHILEKFPA